MCRLAAYLGEPVLASDILVKPVNSLIAQSQHALESKWVVNGDGFGLGWYMPEIAATPGLFKSIQPAWNDLNLLHLTAKLKSPCFLAHVRAATAGGVSKANSHPFVHGRYLFAHNGNIDGFAKFKRHLRHKLNDDMYDVVEGQTDSEHMFALFLQELGDVNKQCTVTELLAALKRMITITRELQIKYCGVEYLAHINLVLTDGDNMIALRYTSNLKKTAASLYFEHIPSTNSTIIASEKPDEDVYKWQEVQDNHAVLISSDSCSVVEI